MKKVSWILLTVFTLCSSIFVSAAEFSKKDIIGEWRGHLADYKSSFSFSIDGKYKSVVYIFDFMAMESIGVWSLENDSLHLDQKEEIKAGERSKCQQRFTRKVVLLNKKQLKLLHNNAIGDPVKSNYLRVK